MDKPMFLAGFPRSGTTKIYHEMLKRYKKVLYEPTHETLGAFLHSIMRKSKYYKNVKNIHPYIAKIETLYQPYLDYFDKGFILKLIHLQPSSRFVRTQEMLAYFELLKGFHIKDIWISFHLTHEFFKKNWDIYWIIRPPEDVFVSIFETTASKKVKILKLIDKLPGIKFFFKDYLWLGYYNRFSLMEAFQFFARFFDYDYRVHRYEIKNNLYKLFTFVWIIDNVIAINDPEFKIVSYLEPKLPFKIEDWKPKLYQKYPRKKFEDIARELGLHKEFEEITAYLEG